MIPKWEAAAVLQHNMRQEDGTTSHIVVSISDMTEVQTLWFPNGGKALTTHKHVCCQSFYSIKDAVVWAEQQGSGIWSSLVALRLADATGKYRIVCTPTDSQWYILPTEFEGSDHWHSTELLGPYSLIEVLAEAEKLMDGLLAGRKMELCGCLEI